MTHTDPHSRSADAVHEGRPVEAQYVRQGRRGTHVLWILAISLPLAILLVWGAWALFFSDDFAAAPVNNGPEVQGAQAFDTAPNDALQTSDQDPTAGQRGSLPGNQQGDTRAAPAQTGEASAAEVRERR